MIAGLGPYPAYKDSGAPWLGEVPEHWDVRRLKSLLAQPVTDGPHLTPEFLAITETLFAFCRSLQASRFNGDEGESSHQNLREPESRRLGYQCPKSVNREERPHQRKKTATIEASRRRTRRFIFALPE